MSETTPGFTAVGWFVLSAPRNTPREVVHRIADDLRSVQAENGLLRRFEELGAVAGDMTPEQAQQFIRAEQKRWRPLVRRVGLTSQ